MRCYCCDTLLTDYESTLKSVNTNDYLDICLRCLKSVKDDIMYKDRVDLLSSEDVDDLDIYLDDYSDDEY